MTAERVPESRPESGRSAKTNPNIAINRAFEHHRTAAVYPSARFVGVVPTEVAAWRVIDSLLFMGFEEADIEIFSGQQGVDCLHGFHDDGGMYGHLRRITGLLGPERSQSEEYEAALRAGRIVLVVKAADTEHQRSAQQVLVSEAGSSMRFYSRFTIRDM